MIRKSYLFVLLLLLLVAAPLSLAQEDMFGLSAEDFALLMSSQDFEAGSLSFDFAVDMDVTGAPDGQVVLDIDGSGVFGESATGSVVGSLSMAGSASMEGEQIPVDFQMRIVDDILYFNLGDGSGWLGQSLDDALESFGNIAPLPVDPADLASGDLSDDPAALEALGDMFAAFEDFDPSTLIMMSRLDDMGGQAHFRIELDLQSFLQSDAFNEMMGAAGSMSGDESLAGMGPMLAMMFQDMSLSFDEFIELETNRVRQGILDFGLTVDPAMMGEADAEPVSVSFVLDVSNLQYDVPVDVSAPEGATIISSAAG